MATFHFDLTYKLYVNSVYTRSNYARDMSSYSIVIFPFNSPCRILRVDSQVSFLPGTNRLFENCTVENIDFRYQLYGFWVNDQNSILTNMPLKFVPTISETLMFEVPQTRMLLSSDSPTYEPHCLYAGGFKMEVVLFSWGDPITIAEDYFARVRLHFEVESK